VGVPCLFGSVLQRASIKEYKKKKKKEKKKKKKKKKKKLYGNQHGVKLP